VCDDAPIRAAVQAGFHPEFALFEAGHKALIKIERVPVADAERRADSLRSHGLAVARRSDRLYGWGGADDVAEGVRLTTLLAARDPETAATAADCDILEASAAPLAERIDASRVLGRLLGYPTCCVEAYLDALLDPRLDPAGDRGHLLPLNATTAPLDPRCNRIGAEPPLLSHHPCRLDCAASAALADAALAVLGTYEPDAPAALLARMAQPVVYFGGGQSIALQGHWEGDVFRFVAARAGGHRGRGDELQAVFDGADGVRARLGVVQLLSGDVPTVDLGALGGPLPRLFDWTGTRAPWTRAPAIATRGPLVGLLRSQGLAVRDGDAEPAELAIAADASPRAAFAAIERAFAGPVTELPEAPRRLQRAAAPKAGLKSLGGLQPGATLGLFEIAAMTSLAGTARIELRDADGSFALRLGPADPRAPVSCGELSVVYEQTERPFVQVKAAAEALAVVAESALDGARLDALRRWLRS
jgi:hypothetical protein